MKKDPLRFLDEDNTVTRGVKKGAGWAMAVKTNPWLKWGLRGFFIALFLYLVLRGFGVL